MLTSYERYELSQDPVFQGRVLMMTLRLCHKLIDSDTDDLFMLTKAREIVTNPESFKDKLAFSIAATLEEFDFEEDKKNITIIVTDDELQGAIDDAFHAIAGVSKQ